MAFAPSSIFSDRVVCADKASKLQALFNQEYDLWTDAKVAAICEFLNS